MTRRLALLFLGLASPAMVVCGWFNGAGAELCFIVLVMAFPPVLIAFSMTQSGRIGPRWVLLVALILILEAGGVAMFLLRGKVIEGLWFGALPGGAAVLIYGLWLGPLVVVALAYGWTFDRWELTEEDLRRYDARLERVDRENR